MPIFEELDQESQYYYYIGIESKKVGENVDKKQIKSWMHRSELK